MSSTTTGEEAGKLRIVPMVQEILLIGVWFLFYYPVMQSLLREWYDHENFSYGFLIPFIFLYLVWDRREVLKNTLSVPSAWGAVVFLGALLLGVAGKVFGEPLVSRISLIVAVIGMVQLFWGNYCVRRLAFPLCYLFLMVPPPYVIVKELSYYLRMFDASVATFLVQAVGVPVYQDTYFMHLPDITLEVADVCSGIASLFAMIALGTIYVYYLPTRLSAKVMVLAGAFIFPLIANLFRLFLVTVSVYYYGPVMLGAFYHSFTGTFTFVLSLLMFLWLGETARRRYPQEPAQASVLYPENARWADAPRKGMARFGLPVLASITVGALVIYAVNSPVALRASDVEVHLEQIAANLGGFAVSGEPGAEAYTDARAEKSISRLYIAADAQVELFVGFNSRQFDESRLQSPKLVFPKNWEYASLEDVQIALTTGQKVEAAELLTKNSEEKRLVLYWYQQRGQAFSSDLLNRVELMKSLVAQRRTDGAAVRVATSVSRFESLGVARARLVSFAKLLYPELVRVLPK